jgi:phosphoribosylanthranilate isomerase
MNYPFKLKFSKIKNLSDARYASGMWADFIGFCFDPSSTSYIEPNKAKEIISWISGPAIVGEFGNQPPEWIHDFVSSFQLKVVQVPASYQHDLNLPKGIALMVEAKESNITPMMEKADILITNNQSVYQTLKSQLSQPIIYQINDLNEDVSNCDGIGLIGLSEDKPGTSNQSAWTEFLGKWEE